MVPRYDRADIKLYMDNSAAQKGAFKSSRYILSSAMGRGGGPRVLSNWKWRYRKTNQEKWRQAEKKIHILIFLDLIWQSRHYFFNLRQEGAVPNAGGCDEGTRATNTFFLVRPFGLVYRRKK